MRLTSPDPVRPAQDYEYTPLHLACKNKHLSVAAVLLDKGADVNATDKVRDRTSHDRMCQNSHWLGYASDPIDCPRRV